MRLAAPVPECAYFAEHIRQSAIADAVAQRSTAYLVRKRVDGLLLPPRLFFVHEHVTMAHSVVPRKVY